VTTCAVARFEGRAPKAALGVSSTAFALGWSAWLRVTLAAAGEAIPPRADRVDVCSTKFPNRRGVR
jgi:hypothetical protein